MAVPVILALVGLGIAATAAVVFWESIVGWAQESLFPWFETNLPELSPYVREAFIHLNKAVMTVRKAAVQAWRKIRPTVLKVVETFEQRTNNEYILKVTSWIREKAKDKTVIKRETEQVVTLDDLPDDVQDAFLRGSNQHEFDVTAEQDRQVEELAHELSI